MFEFVLFGSMVWFWILFGIWALVMFVSVEVDRPGVATLSSLLFFGLFIFWGGIPGGTTALAALLANPVNILIFSVAFFVLGTIWAIVKWWFYVRRLAEKRRAQIKIHGESYRRYGTITKPLVLEEKSRILTWMCFWPFSFVWTMIDDPIRMIFTGIYDWIKGMLQRIADKAFEGLESNPPKDDNSSF